MKKLLGFLLSITFMSFIIAAPVFSSENAHVRVANEWRESFFSVAQRVNSQQVNIVADYLKKNSVIGKLRPNRQMIEVLEQKRVSNLVFVVPVFEGERELAINWEDILFSPPAQFLPAVRSIMIKGDARYSNRGKAIVLSREYTRAYYILNNKYKAGEYWTMERDAQTFQNNFLSFLGEEKYRKYVYAQAKKMIDNLTIKKKLASNFFLLEPISYDNELDAIFGKPISCEEAMCIQKAVWRHIIFVVIENTAKKGKAGGEKIEFVKSLDFYQEGEYQKESLDYPDYGKIRKK